MIELTEQIRAEIAAHGMNELPNEACGLLANQAGKLVFIGCRNDAPSPHGFALNPLDYANAEDVSDKIVAIIHTHTNGHAKPSEMDRLHCEKSGLPWLIMTLPHQGVYWLSPCGYKQELLGRPFEWGASDCFTLVRLYYQTQLGINIDYNEPYLREFWKKGLDLYKNLERFGFVELPCDIELQLHDVLLIRMPKAEIPSHAAIYLGSNKIMHHCEGRLSEITLYNDYWQRYTTRVMRHESLC